MPRAWEHGPEADPEKKSQWAWEHEPETEPKTSGDLADEHWERDGLLEPEPLLKGQKDRA